MAQFLSDRRTELRRGVTKLPVPNTASPDTIRAMPLEMFFDYLGVRLNGDRAAGKTVDFNLELTDTGDKYRPRRRERSDPLFQRPQPREPTLPS